MLKTAALYFFLLPLPLWAAPLTTVDYVNLPRYMGTWYEVASIPQSFQKKCFSDTKAEYSLLSDKQVRVYNSCLTQDRQVVGAEGRAKVEDPLTNAKLKVTFVKIGGRYIYAFGGKYWVIDLDPDYRYAVVGHPQRTYGWILSRDPQMKERDLRDITEILKAKGYDTCKFMITPQRNGFTTKTRLCDLVSSETLQQAQATLNNSELVGKHLQNRMSNPLRK